MAGENLLDREYQEVLGYPALGRSVRVGLRCGRRRLAPVSAERALLAWSSGKDSAFALHVLRAQADVEVVGLLTTVNAAHERVAMHAVRARRCCDAQAAARRPAARRWCAIPSPCSERGVRGGDGARAMADGARAAASTAVAFGDLFLEDVRRYREERLAATGHPAALSALGSADATRWPAR